MGNVLTNSHHTSNALPIEKFALKNFHVPELSEANCHAQLSQLKGLLYNIHTVMLALFHLLMKRHNGHIEESKHTKSRTGRTYMNQEQVALL